MLAVQNCNAGSAGRFSRTEAIVFARRDGAQPHHPTQVREPGRLVNELETAVYQAIQEALNNAHKHGRARRASVEVEEDQTTVRDDGSGFDPAARTTGFGLIGMRERTALLVGRDRDPLGPERGTMVAASFLVRRRSSAEVA